MNQSVMSDGDYRVTFKRKSNHAVENENSLSPRTQNMVESIKKVSDRSPVINVTFNRKEYVPVGSVSPDVIVQMSKRQ